MTLVIEKDEESGESVLARSEEVGMYGFHR